MSTQSVAAAVHALTYSLPFLFFSPSPSALAVIAGTHFVIDRWRLARYIVWAKNWLAPWKREPWVGEWKGPLVAPATWSPPNPPWSECSATGYPPDVPPWLATWLLIIVDNFMHVGCNAAALRWL